MIFVARISQSFAKEHHASEVPHGSSRLNIFIASSVAMTTKDSEIKKYRQAYTPNSTHLFCIGSLAVGVRDGSDARVQSLGEEYIKLALKMKALV